MDIKAGNKPARPITFVFGAKAAPAYTIAKGHYSSYTLSVKSYRE